MPLCVVCCATSASIYCCQDDANLCKACSTMIHSANALAARHTLIPFCALCNVAPSTVFCKNDDAFLCAACDTEAHTGVLACRHERIPAASASASAAQKGENKAAEEVFGESSTGANSEVLGDYPKQVDGPELTGLGSMCDFGVVPVFGAGENADEEPLKPWGKELDNLEVDAAWLDRLDVGLDFTDILDGGEPAFMHDGLVPSISSSLVKEEQYWAETAGPSVPTSDAEVPALEDPNASWADLPSFMDDDLLAGLSDNDMEGGCVKRRKRSRGNLFGAGKDDPSGLAPAVIAYVSPAQAAINRAERLAKCREKRKNRTFEKTIRYATRKAYAEIRPRIKGRFVKKEELEAYKAMCGVNAMFEEDGVVPEMVA